MVPCDPVASVATMTDLSSAGGPKTGTKHFVVRASHPWLSEANGLNRLSRCRTIPPKLGGAHEGETHVETCTTAWGAVS